MKDNDEPDLTHLKELLARYFELKPEFVGQGSSESSWSAIKPALDEQMVLIIAERDRLKLSLADYHKLMNVILNEIFEKEGL